MTQRAVFLTVGLIFATLLWGMSVYSTDVIAGNVPADGYGVSATAQ